MLRRQGQLEGDGVARREPARPAPRGQASASPAEFLRGVRSELRKVAWPSRPEVANYSVVVLITLVFLIFAIFGLNYVFNQAVNFLFGT